MCLMTGSKHSDFLERMNKLEALSPGSICGSRAGFVRLYKGIGAMFTSLRGLKYLQDHLDKIFHFSGNGFHDVAMAQADNIKHASVGAAEARSTQGAEARNDHQVAVPAQHSAAQGLQLAQKHEQAHAGHWGWRE